MEADIADIQLESGEDTTHTVTPLLTTQDLVQIQEDIQQTLRPRTQGPPPNNFGSPSHGKLKADQWRTCIEFDLPISLVKIWIMQRNGAEPEDSHRRRVQALESTLNLSMAIRWAISSKTSEKHCEKYLHHMLAYLESVRQIDPDNDLHPIHHNALHIPLFLKQFGPMRGWWMFFFERLIGLLQKIPINYKFGEFCQSSLSHF